MYKWLLRVNAHPCFLPVNFKHPWVINYSGEFSTTSEASLWNVITDHLLSLPLVQERLLQLLLNINNLNIQ